MPTETSAGLKPASANPPAALRRWLRRGVWGLGALLVLWALAWVAVPPLLQSQLEKSASQALGRKLSLESISFAPWSLELTLRGLKVATADGQGTQLSVDRIYVDAELQSALRLAPVVDAIVVEAPKLRLTHLGGGRYDIDDLLARLTSPPASPPSPPLQFALYNLALDGGEVDFVDQRQGATLTHSIRKLHVSVPFLSNLDSQREVLVEPRLAFELNGSAFDTAAKGTPFAQTRKGEASLRIDGMALAPYLAYLPAALPVKPRAAVLDLDLRLRFEQAAKTSLLLTGGLKLSGLEVADAAGGDLLKVQGVQLQLAEVRPLEKRVGLESLVIDAPSLRLQRNRQGQLNLAPPPGAPQRKEPAAATAQADGSDWQLSLGTLALQGGQVQWQDDAVAPKARMAAQEVALQASALQWPQGADAPPARFEASLALASASARVLPARVAVQGEGGLQGGRAQLQVKDLALESLGPYVAQFLLPSLEGRLALEAALGWKGADYTVDVARLALEKLSLKAAQKDAAAAPPSAAGAASGSELVREWVGWKMLELRNTQVRWPQQTASMGKLTLTQPVARVRRDADGQWMFAQWLKPTGEAATPSNAATPSAAAKPLPWKLQLQELQVADGQVSVVDRGLAKPVFLELSSLTLGARGLTPEGVKPASVVLSSRVRSGRSESGHIGFQGAVQWAPVQARGTVDVVDLPLHAFAPYAAQQLAYLSRIDVQRADANFKGQVDFSSAAAGPSLSVQGDASLDDLRLNNARAADAIAAGASLQEAEEMLSWKSLAVPGIELAMAPGTATRVKLREVSLADFFARLVITPQGQLQLQELVASDAPAAAGAAAQQAPASPAPATAPATAPVAGSAPAAQIDVGPIRLLNGRVAFSDRFIKPNYSASLTELQGRLSRFSSQPVHGAVQMADLELRGRAEGTATLEVTGRLNPLAQPLALDIQGRVRDLELSPLSAYSVKYSGYGIERGKLSVDVSYKVQPDGQLTAGNRIILNQLTFGDKAEGATASLPVKLAVALLADRNGVIDVDLPISGSLNDPQFSIWPVVWKVIGNLITKALTAPFALFSGGGGGDELSHIAFLPGTVDMAPEGRSALDKVARALADRPALRMTVVGSASLEAERDAIKRNRLQAMVLSEKRRVAAAAGLNAAAITRVDDTEYPEVLKEVYRRTDMKKPRNLVGMTKTLPVPEMEAMLLANMVVTDDAVRELAQARGVAVRDYLTGKAVASDRLFLGASRLPAVDAGFKPQAELTLSNR